MEPDFEPLIKALSQNNVDRVIIGGVAMAVHGSSYTTEDFDIAYAHDPQNARKLAAALTAFNPRLRVQGEPKGLPFTFDARSILNGAKFTLLTDAGAVDLLAHIDGFKSYAHVKACSHVVRAFGVEIAVLSVEGLIRAKRATARPKDLLVIPELEVLREAQRDRQR